MLLVCESLLEMKKLSIYIVNMLSMDKLMITFFM